VNKSGGVWGDGGCETVNRGPLKNAGPGDPESSLRGFPQLWSGVVASLRRKFGVLAALLSVIALIALVVRSSTGPGTRGNPATDGSMADTAEGAAGSAQVDKWLAYGDTLPDFSLPTISGDTVRRSDLQGRLALIAFLPFSQEALQRAPERVCELVDSCLSDVSIFLFLATDRGIPQTAWHDSSPVQDLVPIAVTPHDTLWKTFRIPRYACSYLALVDSGGIVRLGTTYIDGPTLRTIIRRYR